MARKRFLLFMGMLLVVPILLLALVTALLSMGVDVYQYVPGKQYVTQWLLSQAENEYGLQIDYQALHFSPLWLTAEARAAEISNSRRPGDGVLVKAARLQVAGGKTQGGFGIEEVEGEKLHSKLAFAADGHIALMTGIAQVEPKFSRYHNAIAAAAQQSPTQVQKSEMDLRMDRIRYNETERVITADSISAGWEGEEEAFVEIAELQLSDLPAKPENPATLSLRGVTVRGTETEGNRYDVTLAMDLILRAAEGLAQSTPAQAQGEKRPAPIGEIHFEDVSLQLKPPTGSLDSPGGIRLQVQRASVSQDGNGLLVEGARILEQGELLTTAERFVIAGITPSEVKWDRVEVRDVELNLAENAGGSINLVRALQRFRALINLPKRSGDQQARAGTALENQSFPALAIQNASIAYHQDGFSKVHFMMDSFRLDRGELQSEGNNIAIRLATDSPASLRIGHFSGRMNDTNHLKEWDEVQIDELAFAGTRRQHGIEPFLSMDRLFEVVNQINEQLDENSEQTEQQAPADEAPFRFRKIALRGGEVELLDANLSEPVEHVWRDVSIDWSNVVLNERPPMGDFSLSGQIVAPAAGSMNFEGQLAPSIDPVFLDGQLSFDVEQLTQYAAYYRKAMPVGIERSAFALEGSVKIDDDVADCRVNVVFQQPQFRPLDGPLASRINQGVAIEAMRGMMNREGNLVIEGNTIHGNLDDPEFQPGTGLFAVLSRNLINRLSSVPNLLLSPVRIGGDILKGVGGVFQSILGGDSPKSATP